MRREDFIVDILQLCGLPEDVDVFADPIHCALAGAAPESVILEIAQKMVRQLSVVSFVRKQSGLPLKHSFGDTPMAVRHDGDTHRLCFRKYVSKSLTHAVG